MGTRSYIARQIGDDQYLTIKEDLENDTVQYSEPPDLEDLLGEDWDEEQEDGPSIEM